jgi:hypothetical protein
MTVFLYSSNHKRIQMRVKMCSEKEGHTLDSGIIAFKELVPHETDCESGLADTSGFVADSVAE